jgi:hypothetical protein
MTEAKVKVFGHSIQVLKVRRSHILFVCLFIVMLRMEPKASPMLGKRLTTEQHPQPFCFDFVFETGSC